MIGKRVSHYRIMEKLGGGGMGVVYKAEDVRLGRMVALKFLPSEWSQSTEAKERFVAEAKTASSIDHPNVCAIYEIDEAEDGRLFIAMNFCDGETLKSRIERGPLTIEQAIDVTTQVAEGLSKAHLAGVIHRDIKPANLMIIDDRIVKIVDFGLAKLANVKRISGRDAVGTVLYMSPEQLRGQDVDKRTDIWSLGVSVYEMISGAVPFDGEYDQAIAYAIVNEEPRPLPEVRPGVPSHVERIVSKTLQKDRGARYQHVEEMLEDLGRVRDATGPRTIRRPTLHEPPKTSIAVLPFADLSAQKDQEYFCDGIAEELIGALTKINQLQVASRTSTLQFKGKGEDIRKVGERLNVSRVLEGSLRREDDKLRIAVQLVNVADGYQIWSDRYDRRMKDVFAVQDEIARTVVEKLRVTLTKGEKGPLVAPHTENLEAYTLHLRGRHLWNQRTEEGLRKSVDYFRQAIDQDPCYARAYAGLADSYATLGIYGTVRPKEIMPRAKAAARQALEYDDTLAEAHTSLACVQAFYDWSWSEAELAFQRAIELDPSYATSHHWYAMNCLAPTGRLEEAANEIEQARALDPLSPAINASLGLVSYFAHRYDEAVDRYLKTLELDGSFAITHFFLGQAHAELSRYDDANDSVRKAIQLSGGSAEMTATLGYIYGRSGDTPRAKAVLEELEEISRQKYVSPCLGAQVNAGLGRTEDALDCLHKAYEFRATDLAWLRVRPMFAPLRSEPRFTALLERIGLGEPDRP